MKGGGNVPCYVQRPELSDIEFIGGVAPYRLLSIPIQYYNSQIDDSFSVASGWLRFNKGKH